jgi:hypothetical protein
MKMYTNMKIIDFYSVDYILRLDSLEVYKYIHIQGQLSSKRKLKIPMGNQKPSIDEKLKTR